MHEDDRFEMPIIGLNCLHEFKEISGMKLAEDVVLGHLI